jgi:hypothetical protein
MAGSDPGFAGTLLQRPAGHLGALSGAAPAAAEVVSGNVVQPNS